MSHPPSQRPSEPDPNLPKPKTAAGKRTLQFLMNIWEPLDVLGQGLLG